MNAPRPSLLGAHIRACREHSGWSLRQLARRVKRSPTHVHDLETGRRVPCAEMVARLARVFDLAPDVVDDYHLRAGHVAPDLVTLLLAHPERWGDVRAMLRGGDRG